MTTTHTAGPWLEFRDDDSHDIVAPDGSHIARVEPRNGLDPLAEQDANGRLLAAAPRLQAALRALTDWAREHTSPRDPDSPHALLVEACAALAAIDGKA